MSNKKRSGGGGLPAACELVIIITKYFRKVIDIYFNEIVEIYKLANYV